MSISLNGDGIVSGVTTFTTPLTGVTTFSSVVVGSGSTSIPSISPSGDNNTGVFFPSADTVALSSGGTERLKVDSDGNINIDSGGVYYDAVNNRFAVGTTTVPSLLSLRQGSDDSYLRFRQSSEFDAGTIGHAIDSRNIAGNANTQLTFRGNPLTFWNNGEAARIDSSGRLLVGTSSNINNANVQVATAQGTLSLNKYANNDDGAELTFTSSRNASIGSHTVVNNNDFLGRIFFRGSDGTQHLRGAEIVCQVDGTPGANDMPGRLVFSTTADGASSPTERMRIGQTGAIQAFSTNNSHSFRSNRTLSTEQIVVVRNNASSVSDGTTVFQVMADGDVENTNNAYGAISDIKLKENIVDAFSQWDDLKALQVRKYNFKPETGHSTHTQIGLIAQEVELVSPGLVGETVNEETGESTKSVNYSVLYMKAVKALQEAMERIETLETNNSEMLARITALEAQ